MSAKRSQASARVRKGPRVSESVEHRRESQIVAKQRIVLTFYASRLKSVNTHRDPGGSWSRNAELSSLLVSSLCVSKVSTFTGIWGGRGREAQNCRHFWSRVFASQKCQHSQGSGGVVVAKRRTVVTFGLESLRLKSVNVHRDLGGVVVAKRRTVVTFGLESLRLKSVNTHRDPGGSWSRSAELSSLLVSSLCVSKVSTVTGIRGGRGREAQNCRQFWSRVFASQKCQQSQGSGGVVVAKRRTVVTLGLVSGLRVSKVSTVTGIPSSRLKSVNSHRDPGGSWSRSAELSSLLALPLERGERRGERREEKREMRGEKRDERRERKGERREERGEKRGRREERGEKRDERREERREEREERRQERGERRGERREERGERRGGRRGERREEGGEGKGKRREERRGNREEREMRRDKRAERERRQARGEETRKRRGEKRDERREEREERQERREDRGGKRERRGERGYEIEEGRERGERREEGREERREERGERREERGERGEEREITR